MSLLERATKLLRAAKAGQEVSATDLTCLAEDAAQRGGALDPQEGRALADVFAELASVLADDQQERARQLGQVQQGRKALRGYGHGRVSKRGQRLRRRV
jgi:hypothetical protein